VLLGCSRAPGHQRRGSRDIERNGKLVMNRAEPPRAQRGPDQQRQPDQHARDAKRQPEAGGKGGDATLRSPPVSAAQRSPGMMAIVPPNQVPNPAPDQPAGSPDRDDQPVLPPQTLDDTDRGWGEQPEPDDDERLRRERPPHWDDHSA
jgi:hypothetical protein